MVLDTMKVTPVEIQLCGRAVFEVLVKDRKIGPYSGYFLVPKKNYGATLDLCPVNASAVQNKIRVLFSLTLKKYLDKV